MKLIILFNLLAMTWAQAQHIESYKWKNRVIVLFDDQNTVAFSQQLHQLNEHKRALIERDMVLHVPKGKEQRLLKNKLGLDRTFNGLILLGKDGSIKFKEPFIVNPQVLFDLVDGMPMRRFEIKRQKGG